MINGMLADLLAALADFRKIGPAEQFGDDGDYISLLSR